MAYTPKIAQRIYQKLQEKGWNAYPTEPIHKLGLIRAIQTGPTTALELNTNYTLFPIAKNPCDPEQIFNATERIARSFPKPPTITLGGREHRLMGITLYEQTVELSGYITATPYERFLTSLESIIDVRPN